MKMFKLWMVVMLLGLLPVVSEAQEEINNAINYELIDVHSVVEMLNNKPKRLHVVLTGRYAKPEIIDMADTVTEMKVVKHAYEKGIKAAKGIEF